MSEAADARSILKALLEAPSALGKKQKKQLTQLQANGWKLLAEESDDLARLKAVIMPLSAGLKKKRGRRHASVKRDTYETDRRVFEAIKGGSTTENAIKSVYGDDGYEGHEKRIKRRKKEMKEITQLAADVDEGGH